MILFESFLSAIKNLSKDPKITYYINCDHAIRLCHPNLTPWKTQFSSGKSLPLRLATPHFSYTATSSTADDQHLLLRISYHCRINHSSYRDGCCQCNNDCTTNTNPVPRPIAATGTAISLLIRSEVRDSTDRPILVPQSYWASSGERVVLVISLFSICHCLSAYHHLLSNCLFSTITFSSFPSNQHSCLRFSLLLDQKTF